MIHRLDTLIDGSETTVLTFHRQDILAGTVAVQHKSRRYAGVARLYVSPLFRNLGIGSRLLQECELIASESGCSSIALLVTPESFDAVARFYLKRGWRDVCRVDGDICFVKLLTPSA